MTLEMYFVVKGDRKYLQLCIKAAKLKVEDRKCEAKPKLMQKKMLLLI